MQYVVRAFLSTGPSASDIYTFCENQDKKLPNPLGFKLRSADPSQIYSLVF